MTPLELILSKIPDFEKGLPACGGGQKTNGSRAKIFLSKTLPFFARSPSQNFLKNLLFLSKKWA
jgi:hypothetical protein